MLDSSQLRKNRKAAGMSPADLSRASGVDATTIIRIEAGQDPRLSTWRKLLAALGLQEGEGSDEIAT